MKWLPKRTHRKLPVKQKPEEKRLSPAKRGYGRDWQKLRATFVKANPICVHCEIEGKVVPVDVVDHIIPHNGSGCDLRLEETNLQSLCHSCHNKKTAKEDGGYGNKKRFR